MDNYTYAHKNTEKGERRTRTAAFNKPSLDRSLTALREYAFAKEIPVSDDESLNFLQTVLSAVKPRKILELGAAIGVSGSVMLKICPDAHLTTIERDLDFDNRAKQNFENAGLSDRVNPILGDVGEVLNKLDGRYDFIFMDCAKVQYIKYLPRLKELMNTGGVLIADDVLLFGYVTGEEEVPKKRKMLVEHIKEYISAVTNDDELYTTILDVGNGIAMSVKK